MAQDNYRIWNQALSARHGADHEAYETHIHLLAREGGFVLGLLLNRVGEDDYSCVARDVINGMSEDDRQKVVLSLVWHSLSHGRGISYRGVIASLNPEWLKAHIEDLVRPFLTENDDYAWSQMLQLLWHVDEKIHNKVAQEAVESSNIHIREAGLASLNIE